jgi:hypothetical protein
MSMVVTIDGVDVTDMVTLNTVAVTTGTASTTLTFAYPPAKGSIITTTGTTLSGGYWKSTYPAAGSAGTYPAIHLRWDPAAIPPEARRAMQEAIIDCSVLSLKRRYEA